VTSIAVQRLEPGPEADQAAYELLSKNQPFVLARAASAWPAMTRWQLDEWATRHADLPVPVWDTEQRGSAVRHVPLGEYLTWLAAGERAADESDLGRRRGRFYLVDWQFARDLPALLQDFEVPSVFRQDWYASHAAEQLRWLYCGGRGSRGRLHVDLEGTSAWLAMIIGRKELVLFEPEAPVGAQEDPFEDASQVTALRCVLEAGDVMFVPAGYRHAARNLTTTLALTQNFVNGYNYGAVLQSLSSRWERTEIRRSADLARLLATRGGAGLAEQRHLAAHRHALENLVQRRRLELTVLEEQLTQLDAARAKPQRVSCVEGVRHG
jgi:hypothetical protein